MKRIRIVMAGAIVFAIGSAFVTKPPDKDLFIANYVQVGTACNLTATICNSGGPFNCGATIYASPATPPATGCITLLTKRDTQ